MSGNTTTTASTTTPAAAKPRQWPVLAGTAPLFSISDKVAYAISDGATLPGLLLDLQLLLTSCEGIMTTIEEQLTSTGNGGPEVCATTAYAGGLYLLRQCLGITGLVQAMTEFPDRPASWGAK